MSKKNPKPYESKTWLYRKYIVERLNQIQIAEVAGTTQQTIQRWLIKHEIVKKK